MLLSNVMDTISEITEGVKVGKGYKITCDGTVTEFNPTDGFYNMDEVRTACGFDYFEIVYMANRQSMFLCDEEGLLYGKNVNPIATLMMQKSYKTNEVGIVGDCVYCDVNAVR